LAIFKSKADELERSMLSKNIRINWLFLYIYYKKHIYGNTQLFLEKQHNC
jgi:hypothetical protein